jgi:tetratricopeptide (TPR) repeat protein/ubiquinone/menaquinone biosynthesis C-methylase UbiE
MGATIDKTLKKAVEAHRAGQLQKAGKFYTAVLQMQPKHPDANHNMGMLAVDAGNVPKALPLLRTALEANPGIGQFWLSYIDALLRLGKKDDAKVVFNQARENGARGAPFDQLAARLNEASPGGSQSPDNQDPPQDQLQPLINLYSQGQLQKAVDQASKLLQEFPNSPTLYNIQGAANRGLKKYDAAIDSFNQVLKINPDYAEAYSNLGVAQKDKGDLQAAVDSFKQAIRIMPDYFEAYYNMGNALNENGYLEAAIDSYRQAVQINPDYARAYDKIGTILKGMILKRPIPGLPELILELVKKKTYVRPRDIVAVSIRLLKLDPIIDGAFRRCSAKGVEASLEQTISDLNSVPLLLELMSVCPLPDMETEAVLTSIRSAVLANISEVSKTTETLAFQSALALQCFTNEYVYNQTEAETEALEALETAVEKKLSSGQQPDPSVIACLASYKALHEYSWCHRLAFPAELETLERRQILEFEEEKKIRSEMPILQEITNDISSKVREQYEESPYPRWVNLGLPLKPKPIRRIVQDLKLRLAASSASEIEAPQILIAGCGTGQHAIYTASRFKDCSVLAIDLSLSSLAYAKRKTEELGITNIEYLQADILDLGKLGRQFDIVESAGVLHHMNDPMAGWSVLADCLKPEGLMMIALYSELARQHIVKMRDEISLSDIGVSNFAMRSFRTDVISSDQEHHKKILSSSDFYSLSTLRDLLFHVQEHRFTIPQIENCLAELGLTFCGFEKHRIIKAFRSQNPDEDALYDLGKWNAFEECNPRTFEGMFQFWCQKVS